MTKKFGVEVNNAQSVFYNSKAGLLMAQDELFEVRINGNDIVLVVKDV